MAIQVLCDNCGKILKNKPDESNPNGAADKHVTLVMSIEGTSSRPIDMDMCVPCAKKIVKALQNPV